MKGGAGEMAGCGMWDKGCRMLDNNGTLSGLLRAGEKKQVLLSSIQYPVSSIVLKEGSVSSDINPSWENPAWNNTF
jgi:hypothetical protein